MFALAQVLLISATNRLFSLAYFIIVNGRFRERSQTSNRYEVRFRSDSEYGLLLLQHKSSTVRGDFLAVAVNHARLELSLNLGKERSWDVRVLVSGLNVSDGAWHTLSLDR